MNWKPFSYLALSAAFLMLQVPAANCADINVEVETGPEFSPQDADTVWRCVRSHYSKKFPFDFYAAPPLAGQTSCPGAEFFGQRWDACWIVDVWHLIEPGLILGSLVLAVLWL